MLNPIVCYRRLLLIAAYLTVPVVCFAQDGASPAANSDAAAQVSDAITKIAQVGLKYAGVLVSVSTVAMAFVELFKAVTNLRESFQRKRLNRWVSQGQGSAMPELLYLAIGDETHVGALCGQPIEKMMGQIQAAARIALDFPDRFPKLYQFLTTSDFETSKDSPALASGPEDRSLWERRAPTVHSRALNEQPTQEDTDATQAKARLASLVSRKLDGFQLETDYDWTRLNQTLSIIFSVVIMEIAIFMFGASHNSPVATLGVGALLGLVGGLLAPFAKDFSQSLASFASK